MPKIKLTEEEKMIRLAERQMKKPKKTEEELVREYAAKVIHVKKSRGHMDKRFSELGASTMTSKDLSLDTDFFFSVVFQSQNQKYEFLKKLGVPVTENQIQIMNGLELAKLFNIELTLEKSSDYPLPDLELKSLVLDNEKL